MKPEPVFAAVEGILGDPPCCPVILMTPQGELLTQKKANSLAGYSRLAIVAGHYEGIDERVREHLINLHRRLCVDRGRIASIGFD